MRKTDLYKIALVMLIIAFDIVTKILLDNKTITVIDGVLSFYSSHNTGAAWSILEGQMLFFILGAVVFVVVISLFDYFVKPQNKWYFFGVSLMLAGTIGNAIDRAALGYVRDFIMLEFIQFPIFNIADISLTVGCVLFSVYILFYFDNKKEKQ